MATYLYHLSAAEHDYILRIASHCESLNISLKPLCYTPAMPDAFGPIRWFDWDAVERHYGGNLPHFELPGGIYFVTFRLADSLPQDVYKKLAAARDAFLAHNPLPHTPEQQDQFKRIYHLPLECNLDRGLGECVLRNRCVRDLLKDTLLHHDCNQYQIGDFVIMPNHVHLLARTRPGLKTPQHLPSVEKPLGQPHQQPSPSRRPTVAD